MKMLLKKKSDIKKAMKTIASYMSNNQESFITLYQIEPKLYPCVLTWSTSLYLGLTDVHTELVYPEDLKG